MYYALYDYLSCVVLILLFFHLFLFFFFFFVIFFFLCFFFLFLFFFFFFFFFFSSRRRHTRCSRDWSSDVCSSDLSAADIATSSGRPSVGFPSALAMATSRFGYLFASIRITSASVRHEVMPWGMFQVAPITLPMAWLMPVPTLNAPASDSHAAIWQASLNLRSMGSWSDLLRFWKRSRMASRARTST